jgi:hypothetical protein
MSTLSSPEGVGPLAPVSEPYSSGESEGFVAAPSSSVACAGLPSPLKRWFATKDTESTRRLRALLEAHEAQLDPRFEQESSMFRERRALPALLDCFARDDSCGARASPGPETGLSAASVALREHKVDFWASTGFHPPTSRAVALTVPRRSGSDKRRFFSNDIVIFVDPRDPRGRRECTGRVTHSPNDASATTAPHLKRYSVEAQRELRACGALPSQAMAIVRRGADSAGLYRVHCLATRVVGGLLNCMDHHELDLVVRAFLEAQEARVAAREAASPPALGARRVGARYELLSADQLESPAENKQRKLRSAVSQWLLRRLSDGLAKWRAFVLLYREHERRVGAAVAIQGMFRSVLARRSGAARRATMLLADAARRKREADELAERRKIEARAARQLWLREHGVSHDGVHFFENKAEQEAWFVHQRALLQRVERQLMNLSTTLKIHALATWRYYVTKVLPPAHLDVEAISRDVGGLRGLLLRELELPAQQQQQPEQNQLQHQQRQHQHQQAPGRTSMDAYEEHLGRPAAASVIDELGDLPQKLWAVAERERARSNAARPGVEMLAPWHASLHVRVPPLPGLGCRTRPNGTTEILDFHRFEAFKQSHAGPTDNSCWLVNGAYARVLFGGYPGGQAHAGAHVTSRSSSVAQLLVTGTDTFVCLLEEDELRRVRAAHPRGWLWNREVDVLGAEIRAELAVGVRACKDAMEFALGRVKRGREVGYGKGPMDQLERALSNRTQDYNRAQAQLDNFCEKCDHVFFPLPKESAAAGAVAVAADERLLKLLRELETRLRRRERLYIFSLGGSGRAGVIAAALLGRLYGVAPLDALERTQRCHDAMARFAGQAPGTPPRSCPRSAAQRNAVERVLQRSDPVFDSIVVRAARDSSAALVDDDLEREAGAGTVGGRAWHAAMRAAPRADTLRDFASVKRGAPLDTRPRPKAAATSAT